MKIHWFFWALCLFMCSCGSVVTIGDNGQLPSTDAGEDTLADVQVDAPADAQSESSHQLVLYVDQFPGKPGLTVNTKDKYVPMLWLNLLGDEYYDLTITSLRVTRTGKGQASSVKVILLDKDFKSVMSTADLQPFDPATQQVAFTGLMIKVPAMIKKSLMLVAVFDGQPAEQHALSIAQATDITLEKGVVMGEFPIQGPTYTMADGPDYLTQLVYDFQGVPAPVTLKGGEQHKTMLSFEARSIYYKFWFYGWGFDLTALDGGKVRGSQGTYLIKQARMLANDAYVSDGMFMDQTKTDPGAASMSFRFDLPQLAFPIEVGCATNKLFDVEVDLAATEDEPGEFFGHKYRLDLHMPVFGNDLFIVTFADFLNPRAVEPKASLQGSEITILSP